MSQADDLIHFRQLKTPAQDAVLGIDSSGSYTIAVGGQRLDTNMESDSSQCYLEENPPLVLRFYGTHCLINHVFPLLVTQRGDSPSLFAFRYTLESSDSGIASGSQEA